MPGDDVANVGLQTGRRSLGVSELYDLQRDPQGLNNVYDDPDYAEIRGRMAMQMLDWHIQALWDFAGYPPYLGV